MFRGLAYYFRLRSRKNERNQAPVRGLDCLAQYPILVIPGLIALLLLYTKLVAKSEVFMGPDRSANTTRTRINVLQEPNSTDNFPPLLRLIVLFFVGLCRDEKIKRSVYCSTLFWHIPEEFLIHCDEPLWAYLITGVEHQQALRALGVHREFRAIAIYCCISQTAMFLLTPVMQVFGFFNSLAVIFSFILYGIRFSAAIRFSRSIAYEKEKDQLRSFIARACHILGVLWLWIADGLYFFTYPRRPANTFVLEMVFYHLGVVMLLISSLDPKLDTYTTPTVPETRAVAPEWPDPPPAIIVTTHF